MVNEPTNQRTNEPDQKIRVVVFGSFYRGYYVLRELLSGSVSENITIVGIATDDPTQKFVNPQRRVWQYPHTIAEREMVSNLARKYDIPIYNGRVKTPEFYDLMETKWKPDLCIMATFGQKINARLFEAPPLGFFNLHPCIDDKWPSDYAGCNPFQKLLDNKKEYAMIVMHRVDEDFDSGELIAYSEKVFIPEHADVVDMHKITSFVAARLAAREIAHIIKS